MQNHLEKTWEKKDLNNTWKLTWEVVRRIGKRLGKDLKRLRKKLENKLGKRLGKGHGKRVGRLGKDLLNDWEKILVLDLEKHSEFLVNIKM